MSAATAVADGGVIMVGDTSGNWNGMAWKGGVDFAVVKLGPAGTVIWRWQVKTCNVMTSIRCSELYRSDTRCSYRPHMCPTGIVGIGGRLYGLLQAQPDTCSAV